MSSMNGRHWLVRCVHSVSLLVLGSATTFAATATSTAIPRAIASEGERVLFDFEQDGLSTSWSANGEIAISRLPLPVVPEGDHAPAGKGVRIEAEAKAWFVSKAGTAQAKWTDAEELAFWIYRTPEEAARGDSTIELWLLEGDGSTRFWRKVTLEHEGWQRIELSLRYFRWRSGRLPQWQAVERVGFYFRDEANLWIDHVSLVDDRKGPGSIVPLAELRAAAFPSAADDEVFLSVGKRLEMVTDCEELDLKLFQKHVQRVSKELRHDFRFLGDPIQTPRLIVFSAEEDYRAFPSRYAQLFNSSGPRPGSDGFTFVGCATSYWDEVQGTLRPTFTHEFVHSWFTYAALLPGEGDWLNEGTAVHYQLRFHPQEGFAKIVREGLEKEDHRLPLAELCDGSSIPTNRYWQACTVVEMLMESKRYKRQFQSLVLAMRSAGSVNLGSFLESELETNWDELETEWRSYCSKRYAEAK